MNWNLSVLRPEVVNAAIAAQGPGIGVTAMPCARQRCTEACTWIGDPWSARVGNEGNLFTRLQIFEDLIFLFRFGKFVKALQGLFDLVMVEEFRAMACVFAEDIVTMLQKLDRSEGDI